MKMKYTIWSCTIFVGLAMPTISVAQTLTGDEFIAYLQQLQRATQTPKNLVLLGVQSAPTAPHGVAFTSLSGQAQFDPEPGENDLDGSFALGMGFGDASQFIGIQPSVSVNSLTDDFADAGSFGIKVSREIPGTPAPVYIGVSVDQLLGWGDSEDLDPSVTGVISAYPEIDPLANGQTYPLALSIGFNSEANDGDFGAIAGVGVGLTENIGASVAWAGDQVVLGAGLRFKELPYVTFSGSINDPFDQADNFGATLTISVSTGNLLDGNLFQGVY